MTVSPGFLVEGPIAGIHLAVHHLGPFLRGLEVHGSLYSYLSCLFHGILVGPDVGEHPSLGPESIDHFLYHGGGEKTGTVLIAVGYDCNKDAVPLFHVFLHALYGHPHGIVEGSATARIVVPGGEKSNFLDAGASDDGTHVIPPRGGIESDEREHLVVLGGLRLSCLYALDSFVRPTEGRVPDRGHGTAFIQDNEIVDPALSLAAGSGIGEGETTVFALGGGAGAFGRGVSVSASFFAEAKIVENVHDGKLIESQLCNC